MNIVNKLTLRHLKENKGRTVVTTLGICVSVAMITAVFVAIASIMNLLGELSYYSDGHYEAIFNLVTNEQYEKLKKDVRISRVGFEGETVGYRLDNRKNDRAGTGDIKSYDAVAFEQFVTGKYDGVLPKNENEIAVEKELIESNHLDWKIGDTVSVPYGERYYNYDGGDGDDGIRYISGGYDKDEKFNQKGVGEYKITAILYENSPTISSSAKILRYAGKEESGDVSINLSKLDHNALNTIKDIVKEYGIDNDNYTIHRDSLEAFWAIDENSALATTFIPMGAIVLVIIIIASVVLIYNAFGMSLSERIRYLGMLASVGATKKQKKKSVYFEGFLLGAIGIPVGVIAGIVGIGITLNIVGDRIISTGMILGIENSDIKMKTVVSPFVILLIVFFSVLTIFISSFIPSRKASSITPIDAIRQNSEIKIKAKKLKTPKIVRKIFGYEGELALKNIKRNGRKSRIITVSIALSVVLFLTCNYFCQMIMTDSHLEDMPYQVSVSCSDPALMKKELSEVNEIEKFYAINFDVYIYDNKDGNTSLDHGLSNSNNCTSAYKDLFKSRKYVYVNTIEDEVFNKLCSDNGIDSNKYYSGTLKGIILNNVNHSETGSKVFNENMLDQKILFSSIDEDGEPYEYRLDIEDFAEYDKDNYVFSLNPKGSISVYIPESMDKDLSDSGVYQIGVVTKEHEKVTDSICKIIDENSFEYARVDDLNEQMQTINTLVFVAQVFIYGFITLISLITIANIINTISTGIMLRRKEFAMLKSVGTTPKGFNKMIVLESAFYGIRAVVFALPISLALCFALNRLLGSSSVPFEIDIALYIIVMAVVFGVIGLTMLYSIRKLKNDSIVETLKKEIN